MLVTDYSSIYFDYLLLDKPIIFFNYDLEEYLNNSRDMYFNYDEFTPGRKYKTRLDWNEQCLMWFLLTKFIMTVINCLGIKYQIRCLTVRKDLVVWHL